MTDLPETLFGELEPGSTTEMFCSRFFFKFCIEYVEFSEEVLFQAKLGAQSRISLRKFLTFYRWMGSRPSLNYHRMSLNFTTALDVPTPHVLLNHLYRFKTKNEGALLALKTLKLSAVQISKLNIILIHKDWDCPFCVSQYTSKNDMFSRFALNRHTIVRPGNVTLTNCKFFSS